MVDATGVVVALDGDYAVVRVDEGGCGRCHEQGGCGGKNIGKMFCAEPLTFRVLNPKCAAVGKFVTVVSADGVVRRSALIAYGLPLLALFFGAILGGALAGDIGSIFGALFALLMSWFALRLVRLRGQTEPFIR